MLIVSSLRRQIDYEANGKPYKLNENPAVLLVRCVFCSFQPIISRQTD